MATNTYTVKKGDTLSEIAQKYKSEYGFSSTYAYVDELVKINDIANANYIVVGQVIKLSGTAATVKKNTTSKPTIKVFGLQSNTDRTVYATWSWDKSNTNNYRVIWYYDTGDGVWFIGNDSTVTVKQSTYNAPTNAKKVKFKVKPNSKTRKVNGKETTYWTASWSTTKSYSFSNNPPSAPSVPSIEIKEYKLTTTLSNIASNASIIQFEVVKNDATVVKKEKVAVKTATATYTCNVAAGGRYKVRCRAYGNGEYSDWTNYSENKYTIPSAPVGFTKCISNETSDGKVDIFLQWDAVDNATKYDIEYTTEKSYFDGSNGTTTISGIETTQYTVTGLENGDEYFFRLRAANDKAEGSSAWSEIKSTVSGKAPAAPTTWSSANSVVTGESATLYWIHNSEDGSNQTYALLRIKTIKNGVESTSTYTLQPSTNEKTEDNRSYHLTETAGYCRIDASGYEEGVKIQWSVKTSGVSEGDYSEWSIERSIDIYAEPTLELTVTDSEGASFESLESFPFKVSALAGPNTQRPIGYYVSIVANEIHETVDNMGNMKVIGAGEQVYYKYFDISEKLEVTLTPADVNLENNISYTLKCTVAMNSGLTTEASCIIDVSLSDELEYEPNAEIGINDDSFSAYIRPYCEDAAGSPISDVLLSVYRREFDGSFTELAKDIVNTSNTFITDPHPSLDYARYRIVATSQTTGEISYYDVPGYPVGCKAAIIQWDEEWSTFDTTTDDELEQPAWSGSLLLLPYNLDVSDSNDPDVAVVEYIGRKYPVAYYGTQLGGKSTWNMEIPADDKETLYALRRLQVWMGNVYVREPSGSGYWAQVKVSFDQKHCEVTIPVTIDITRVEGGA